MGLDNGIVIRIPAKSNYITIPILITNRCEWSWIAAESTHINEDNFQKIPYLNFEMLYWRKWWGPRNEVMNYLRSKYYSEEEEYRYNLDADDCAEIIDILRYFRDSSVWSAEAQSIWEYDEDNIEDQIDIDIDTLQRLVSLMQTKVYADLKEKGLEIYFYDSY
jgi:hypothetical protein